MTHPSYPGYVVHRTYGHYVEHVYKIYGNPKHEAYHMGIKTDGVSDRDLITQCFLKLVLYPYSNEPPPKPNTQLKASLTTSQCKRPAREQTEDPNILLNVREGTALSD